MLGSLVNKTKKKKKRAKTREYYFLNIFNPVLVDIDFGNIPELQLVLGKKKEYFQGEKKVMKACIVKHKT